MRKLSFLPAVAVVAALCTAPAVAGKADSQLASGGFFLWLTDAGTATCVNGTRTAWFPPCSPGTHNSIWRNFVGAMQFAGVDGDAASFFTGIWAMPGNCNLDENLVGACWGTFQGEALGGTWEGTWSGKLDFVRFGGDLRFVGLGTGGGVEGLHVNVEAVGEGSADEYAPMPFTARVFNVEQ